MPGLPDLSAEQLFFLNFAQVINSILGGTVKDIFIYKDMENMVWSIKCNEYLKEIFYYAKVWCGASNVTTIVTNI